VVAESLKKSIPTMIVQTLVENAVKHGVAQVRGTARLTVNARLHGERLRVEVADNGPGFAIPSPGRATEGEGFGLKSVRQRLEGHFGDRAAMEVERDDRSGTTVVAISLPPRPPTDQSVRPARTGPGAA
jgi:LytS/YehU family sensor histidine kinase